jgi:hypothetical protein
MLMNNFFIDKFAYLLIIERNEFLKDDFLPLNVFFSINSFPNIPVVKVKYIY